MRKARRLRNAQILIFLSNRSRIFIKAVRAMAASGAAAIAAFEVELFGENLPAFGREIIIFALDQFIFLILFFHHSKPNETNMIFRSGQN